MARPLRLERAGGRFHITSRGNERKPVFRDDRDRHRFLDALEELPVRFGTRLHAYVLMDNHYHLLVETPEPNLSRTIQWLNVTYTTRFNRRHRRSGHLLQGRFKSILIEDMAGLQAVARYLHLNPVRVQALGLDRKARDAQRVGVGGRPQAELIRERLEVLRNYPWSSYRCYAGYAAAPPWLWTGTLQGASGGRGEREQQLVVREETERWVREGAEETPWKGLFAGVVLGTEDFARAVLATARRDDKEQSTGRLGAPVAAWQSIVRAVEAEKGEAWPAFRDRHGDWGRDVALWLGRTRGRLRLRELAELVGLGHYVTVCAAVRRVQRRRDEEPTFRSMIERLEGQL